LIAIGPKNYLAKMNCLPHLGPQRRKKRGYYCTEGNQKVLVGPPFKTYERTTS
jgi:hypothetical protein